MADTASLKIKLEIDKANLKKQVEGAITGTKVSGGGGGGKGGGGGAGGAAFGGAMLGGIIGALAPIQILGEAILNVIQPVMKMVGLIAKMIALLLMPIVQIVVIFLKPILMILKPIIKAFWALFRGVIKDVNKGVAAATGLISKGMKAGGAGGEALVGKGMETALASIGLLLMPLIDLATGPLRFAISMILKAIAELIDFITGGAIPGIKVAIDSVATQIAGGVNDNAKVVKDLWGNVVTDSKGNAVTVQSYLNIATEALRGVVTEGVTLNSNLDALALAFGDEAMLQAIKDLGTDVLKLAEVPTNVFTTMLDDFKKANLNDTWNSFITNVKSSLGIGGEKEKKPGMWTKVADTFKEIGTGGRAITQTYNPKEYKLKVEIEAKTKEFQNLIKATAKEEKGKAVARNAGMNVPISK